MGLLFLVLCDCSDNMDVKSQYVCLRSFSYRNCVICGASSRGSVYFADCGMRNFDHVYFAEILMRMFRKLYVVLISHSAFRIPQNTVSRYARQNAIVISRT